MAPLVGSGNNIRFMIRADASGGVRLSWNKEDVVLPPDEAIRVMSGIAGALGVDANTLANIIFSQRLAS